MKKSLKGLLKKMEENGFGGVNEGFTVLKNIRGGTVPGEPGTNQNLCQNDGTCTSTNAARCVNNRCGDASNTGCSNYGVCFA